MNKVKEIKELTGIRFFAALHVLFYHNYYISGAIVSQTPQFMKNVFSFGESAVAFFFILSGFILSYVYVDENKKFKTNKKVYAWARFSRLYPVYILALLMDLPRGISFFFDKYDLGTALIKIGISLTAYITMVQSWHPRLTASWNSPAWSLSTEAFFYLVFPFVIPLVFKLKSNVLGLIVFYLLPIALYILLRFQIGIDFDNSIVSTFWRSFPILRVNEFLVGVFLGKMYLERGRVILWLNLNSFYSTIIFWTTLLLSLIAVGSGVSLAKELVMRMILVPCFSIMILTLATSNISFTSLFRSRVCVLLGGASFTLYIIHQPVLYYVNMFKLDPGMFLFSIYTMITISASILIFKFFEVPMQRMLRKRNPFISKLSN